MRTSDSHSPATSLSDEILTEIEAARYLKLKPDTLKVWRSKTRSTGIQHGPLWSERAGSGRSRIIRYLRADIQEYIAAGVVRIEPKRAAGRPRKDSTELRGIGRKATATASPHADAR